MYKLNLSLINYNKYNIREVYMYKRYAYIDCFGEIDEVPFSNPFIKLFGIKSIKKHILKNFPYTIDDIIYQGIDGYKIKIPIITSINCDEDEEYIKIVIESFNRLIHKYNINVLILCEKMKSYISEFDTMVALGEELGILYIQEILDEVKKGIEKEEKDISYVLIDGVSTNTEYILDTVTKNINSLILVTDIPNRYEEKLQEIYLDTGLAIQIRSKSINQEINGDIVINCSKTYDKLFYCFHEDAKIIDFLSSKEKKQSIKSKRKELEIISDYNAELNGEKLSSDIILGLLLNQNRVFRSMYLYGYRNGMHKRINDMKQKYKIQFKLKNL